MLNVMRSNLRHLKWILGIVAFSMVLYLGSYFDADMLLGKRRGGADKDWAAIVGKTEIPTVELQRHLGNLEEGYRQQFQGQFDAFRKALRLPQMALNDLINRTLMIEEAHRMGLTVSDVELRAAIVSHPAFRNTTGFVGRQAYEQVLSANGLSPAGFERSLTDELLLGKWRAAVMGPIAITDAEIEKAYRENAESVSYDYITVPAGTFPPSEATDAEARAWFARNTDRYRKGEGRSATYALIPASAAGTGASAEEAKAYYDANPASFERPEQRRVRHILIPGDDAAKAKADDVYRQVTSGGDFDALAKQYSSDTGSAAKGGDLGWFGRGVMVPEFEQAAFGAKPGETVGPVKTQFGWHILRVEAAREAGKVPFDEVRDAIVEQLSAPKRNEALSAKAAELTAADAAGFEARAKEKGYTVRETGVVFPGGDIPGLTGSPQAAGALFQTPVNGMSSPVPVEGGMVVFKVTGTAAPVAIAFEQVRTNVLADLRAEKAKEAAEKGVRSELAAAGDSLEALAAKFGPVQKAGPVGKGQPLPGIAGPDSSGRLFAAGPGSAPIVIGSADGSVTIAKVTAHAVPNPADFAARREEIRSMIEQKKGNEILSTFVRQLRQGTEIRTNNELLERLSS